MSLVVVGSVALDSVETPTETRENVLGGSAVFFTYAASFFTGVKLVSVVGEDWPAKYTELLNSRGIDTSGLDVVSGGKTFFWRGRYLDDMNQRETLDVQLNVFGEFDPKLPEAHRRCKYLFLANGPPAIQARVLDQCPGTQLSVADTMDLWIKSTRPELDALLRRVDGLLLNDGEAKLLAGEENLVKAGHAIRRMGPRFVIIKKGEHGAMFFGEHETYVMPAYPTEDLVDPTGAGDSFGGGMMGYLAEQNDFSPAALKKAMAYGTLAASFAVEGFSLDGLQRVERADIDRRMEQYRRMLSF